MFVAIISAKDAVVRNKTKLLVGALAISAAIIAAQRAGLNEHNQFLKEHDLYDEYYALTDEQIAIIEA